MSTSNRSFTGLKTAIRSAIASPIVDVESDIERLTFVLDLDGLDTSSPTTGIKIADFLGTDKLIISARISGNIHGGNAGRTFQIATMATNTLSVSRMITPAMGQSNMLTGFSQAPTTVYLLPDITIEREDIGVFVTDGSNPSAAARIVLELVVVNI